MKECMDVFSMTVVGGDALKTTWAVFSKIGVKEVNPVNEGRLGNFKTVTVSIEIPESQTIGVRKRIMGELAKESTHLLPMYPHGEWMHVYVFDRRAFIE